MADIAELGVVIRLDEVRKARGELQKFSETGRQAEQQTEKLAAASGNLSNIMSRLKGLIAGVGFALSIRAIVNAVAEEERVVAKLNVAIRNSGSDMATTSKRMRDFADQMSNLTGLGNETFIEMQALLLTFKNIGQDVIPRMVVAATDANAVLGGGLVETLRKLARAINDPVRGLESIQEILDTKVPEATVKTIKALVETGRMAEAQEIILRMLERRFQGSAAAARDTLGGALVALGTAAEDAVKALGNTQGVGLRGAVEGLVDIMKFLDRNANVVAGVLAGAFAGAFVRLIPVIRSTTLAIFGLNAALLANPFGLAAVAIGSIVAVLVTFSEELGLTQEKTKVIWEGISQIFTSGVDVIRATLAGFVAIFEQVFDDLRAPLAALAREFYGTFSAIFRFAATLTEKFGGLGAETLAALADDLKVLQERAAAAYGLSGKTLGQTFVDAFNESLEQSARERAARLAPPDLAGDFGGAGTGTVIGITESEFSKKARLEAAALMERIANARRLTDLAGQNIKAMELEKIKIDALTAARQALGEKTKENSATYDDQLRLLTALNFELALQEEELQRVVDAQEKFQDAKMALAEELVRETAARKGAVESLKFERDFRLAQLKDLGLLQNQYEALAMLVESIFQQRLPAAREQDLLNATDWASGVERALQRMKKEAADMATLAEDALVNTFASGEDALMSFIETGQLNFRNFVASISRDLARLAFNRAFTAAFSAIFPSAQGNAFANGKVIPFAKGGVVAAPTVVPMASMAEAGPEAIMPLKRDRAGRLGVSLSGGGPSIQQNISVSVQGGSNGNPEDDRRLANEISRQLEVKMSDWTRQQMRIGGVFAPVRGAVA